MLRLPNIPYRPDGRIPTTAVTNELARGINGLAPVTNTGQLDSRLLAVSGIIPVLNSSGSDLVRGNILGISGPYHDPATDSLETFLNDISVEGVIPAAPTHYAKWGILVEDCDDGDLGFLQVSGIACARINVVNAAHFCAGITDSDPTKLTSTPIGVARILTTFTISGVTYCYFVFGSTYNLEPLSCPA